MKKRAKKDALPRRADRVVLAIAAFITVLLFDTKVKIQLKNNVGKMEKPAMVLCNHGSFIDFVYAGRMVRKYRPQFVSARLYFYHKLLGKLLRRVGCIPKSMFANDLENARRYVSFY